MFAKQTTRATLAALALALAACDGGGGGGPMEPVAGILTLSIDAPDTDDRAMVLQITGPDIGEVTAARATHRLFTRALPGGGVRAAVFGSLSDGPLLRFEVPDVSKASQYAATVSEVADVQNEPRTGALGYGLSIARE